MTIFEKMQNFPELEDFAVKNPSPENLQIYIFEDCRSCATI